jgi:hypothetical protein
MAVNIFETRFLTDLVMQRKGSKSFLRNAFWNVAPTIFKTRHVDMPLWDSVRRIAYYIGSNNQSQYVDKEGYKTQAVVPSLISLSDSTTVEDLLRVLPGEIIQYSMTNPREDAVLALANQLAIYDDMVGRAEELQCRQALFDARTDFFDINGNPTEEAIEYDRNAENTMNTSDLTGSVWSDATNARPFDDEDKLRRIIQKHSGEVADVAVYGEVAWKDFQNTAQFKDRWLPMAYTGNDPFIRQMEEDGAVYRGSFNGFKHFTYDEWYRDDISTGGDLVPYIPPLKVLLASSKAKTQKLYGAVDFIPEGDYSGTPIRQLFAAPRVVDSFTRKDPDIRKLRIQSRPLMAMRQPNAYGTLDAQ